MATPPPPAVVAEMRIALALAASASAARWPFTSDPLDFWAGGGKLYVSSGAASARLHIKGVSWFGFETSTACVHELWAHSLDAYLNFLVTHEFNAIRLPLAIDNVLNNPGLAHSARASICTASAATPPRHGCARRRARTGAKRRGTRPSSRPVGSRGARAVANA